MLSSTTGDTPTAAEGSDHVPVDVILDLTDIIEEPIYTIAPLPTSSILSKASTIKDTRFIFDVLLLGIAIPVIAFKKKKR